MALETRDVVGNLHKPDGTAWVGATVKFILRRNVGDGNIIVPFNEVEVVSGALGAFSATLYTITGSSLPWRCILPNETEFTFDLVPGVTDLELSDALNSDGVYLPNQPLYDYIDQQIAEAGGGSAIGGVIASAIEGSVLFAGPLGILAQANVDFFYDPLTKRLSLGDKNFIPFTGAATRQYLALGQTAQIPVGNLEDFMGVSKYFQLLVNGTSQYCIGEYSHLDIQGSPVSPNVFGRWVRITSNNSFPGGTGNLYGDYITVDVGGQYAAAYGLTVNATAGGSGASGLGIIGAIRAVCGMAHNGDTGEAFALDALLNSSASDPSLVTLANAIKARATVQAGLTVTDLRGLLVGAWDTSGGVIENSVGIYADTTIDVGTVSKFFIKSLSTSPSELAGPLSVPSDPFTDAGWTDNDEVPTKGDIQGMPYLGSAFDIRTKHISFNDCFKNISEGHFILGRNVSTLNNNFPVNMADYPGSLGIFHWARSAVSNASGSLYEGNLVSSDNFASIGILGGGTMRTRFRFSFLALSDAVNTYVVRAGVGNGGMAVVPLDGCFFRYAYNVNGGKWQAVATTAGVETVADTGVLAAVDGMHTFGTVVNAAGTEAKYYIDDLLVATITTNIPTTAQVGAFWHYIRSAGVTDGLILATDYAWSEWNFTNPR